MNKEINNNDVTEEKKAKSESDAKDKKQPKDGIDNIKIKNSKKSKEVKNKKDLKYPLCKLVKRGDLKDHFKDYQKLVREPVYICRKCGRTANNKKVLCAPVKMD